MVSHQRINLDRIRNFFIQCSDSLCKFFSHARPSIAIDHSTLGAHGQKRGTSVLTIQRLEHMHGQKRGTSVT